ncbi:SET and MYND domain-containing protein 4 [Rhizoclosmatium sp. JEL0117]|nr:SET and MYND domain-containing protein 4 [Rhizoclosmatium sp. JEL0117]
MAEAATLNALLANLPTPAALLQPVTPTVDAQKSEMHRNAGNVLFKRRDWREAAQKYSSAIRCATLAAEHPEQSQLRALAFANRSAALFELGMFRESLVDVHFAMDNGYPDDLMPKLLRRRASCLLAIWKDASRSSLVQLESCSALVDLDDRNQNGKDIVETALKDALESVKGTEIEKLVQRDVKEWDKVAKLPLKPTTKSKSEKEVWVIGQNDKTNDRRLLASSNVSNGTVVIQETPTASVLDPKFYNSRCFECSSALGLAPQCCDSCVNVWFCSAKCKSAPFHTSVCFFLPHITQQQDLLSLKLYFLLRDVPSLTESIISLKSHINDRTTSTLEASLSHFKTLTLSLNLPENTPILLTQLFYRIECNSFTIKSTSTSGTTNSSSTVETKNQTPIGTAIYARASLFNHNCIPNCIAFFDPNGSIRVQTCRDVAQGEELNISYGPMAGRMNRDERKQALKEKWFFECRCVGCLGQQDGGAVEQSRFLKAFRCPSIGCDFPVDVRDKVCGGCGVPVEESLQKAKQTMLKAMKVVDYVQANTVDESVAVEQLQTALEAASAVSHPLSHQLCTFKDVLAQMYADKGNFNNAGKLIASTLPTISLIFGEKSVEHAQEMFKLCTLWYSAKNFVELKEVGPKCLDLYVKLKLDEEEQNELEFMLTSL